MKKLARVLTTTLAALAASFAFTAGAAQATPDDALVYLYTTTLADCTSTGDNGIAGGAFSDYECVSGIAGYSVRVEPTFNSFTDLYLTVQNLATCNQAGTNGVNGGVWADYECRLGIAGYSLLVSN
ncbi:hypothetical protein FHS29_003012 [Saccharothrix tamanrassetensis]|uniref:Uncharacterized protein n=1 Tax=Saccharothrix tamanrassetensis TaxID=1051531 RepID=A0A841CLH1_9PSEU|nr:hypothetical protein [Saccharothrix tamanrassetensis]MBB5956426.1 hypothetical protein [Saccharothrix tamanrassetensis]